MVAPANYFFRDRMTAGSDSRGHPLNCKFDTAQREKQQLKLIASLAQLQYPLHVRARSQRALKGKAFLLFSQMLDRPQHYAPASNDAASGLKADNPEEIVSAFTNSNNPNVSRKRDAARVVFPAPLGPAMTTI